MYEGVSCLRAQDMKSEFLSQMLIEAMIVGNISTEEASGHPPCTHPLPLATRHFPSARLSRETYLQRSALLSLARKWISWISFDL